MLESSDFERATNLWLAQYGYRYHVREDDIRTSFTTVPDTEGPGTWTIVKFVIRRKNGEILGHVSLDSVVDDKKVF